MKILIFGAGAIGCHIGYCMYLMGCSVMLVARGQHFQEMKKNGLKIRICDNEIIKTEDTVRENPKFEVFNDLQSIGDKNVDYIFITQRLTDFNAKALKSLSPYMGKNTAVIPPCTSLPFWWFYNLPKNSNKIYNNIDFDPEISKYFRKTNIIGVTMWLSAVLEEPGLVVVKHVQRGYPLAPLYSEMDGKAANLQKIFDETCVSPLVEDIRSEIFIKSINSFAFNLVAVEKEFNNLQLSQDQESKDSVARIMVEGDQILETLGIPIIQGVQSRITQTLSSNKHTMSMLHAFQHGKPIELKYQWDSFHSISKILKVDMPYSKQIFEKVMTKVCANGKYQTSYK